MEANIFLLRFKFIFILISSTSSISNLFSLLGIFYQYQQSQVLLNDLKIEFIFS